jgi:hypothetical protein
MALKDLFNKPFELTYCPFCARIKKHGKWVTLTSTESQKLSSDHRSFSLTEEKCSFCIKIESLVGLS